MVCYCKPTLRSGCKGMKVQTVWQFLKPSWAKLSLFVIFIGIVVGGMILSWAFSDVTSKPPLYDLLRPLPICPEYRELRTYSARKYNPRKEKFFLEWVDFYPICSEDISSFENYSMKWKMILQSSCIWHYSGLYDATSSSSILLCNAGTFKAL